MKNFMIDIGIPVLWGLLLGNIIGNMMLDGHVTPLGGFFGGLLINVVIFFILYPPLARFLKGEK